MDSNIDQECIENGCGTTEENPFKTITWTLQMIMPSENNIVTIHLAEGTYSSLNAETFPIIMIDYVNMEGINQETTILDAEQTGQVIVIENCENNTISKLTCTCDCAPKLYISSGFILSSKL